MPVVGMDGCKGPSDPLPGKTCCHRGISGYIGMVVEIYNEPVEKSRRVNGEDNNRKEQQETYVSVVGISQGLTFYFVISY